MGQTHTLPVSLESITALGYNPLRQEWKHCDLGEPAKYMEFAWDFKVSVGTPVYARNAGRRSRVFHVKVDSDLEPQPGEIEQILKNPQDPKLIQRAIDLFLVKI